MGFLRRFLSTNKKSGQEYKPLEFLLLSTLVLIGAARVDNKPPTDNELVLGFSWSLGGITDAVTI